MGGIVAADWDGRWALVVEHRAALVRVARSRGLAPDEAEDCAQEALARAVAFPGLDESRVLPFLVTTTLRLCADHGRERGRSARLRAKLAGWHTDEPPPDEDVCDRAVATQLAGRLARLPERQRTALLAHASGLTHADIARLIGSTVKGVESLLGRARVELRRTVTFGVLLAGALLGGGWRRRKVVAAVAVVPVAACWLLAVRVAPAPATEDPAPAAVPYEPAPAPDPGPAAATVGPGPVVRRTRPPLRTTPPATRPPRRDPAPTASPCVAPSEQTGLPPFCPADGIDREDLDDCVEYGPDLSQGVVCPSPTEENP